MHRSTYRAPTFTDIRTASTDRQPTTELVIGAQHSRVAREQLLVRCLPAFERWASHHLPAAARDQMDTCDLVQRVVLQTLGRLEQFRPEHGGSMPAYLRMVAKSRVCDELRRRKRQPAAVELDPDIPSHDRTPLDAAIDLDRQTRYRAALATLRTKDRRLVIARHHLDWSFARIARRFGLRSEDAARMAVMRAQRRVGAQLACCVSSSE